MIADLYEKLEENRERKRELFDRVQAYKSVEAEFAKKQGLADGMKLHAVIQALKEKKDRMENDADSKMTV